VKTWQVIILTAVVSILGVGSVWLVSSPPRGEPIELLPPPTTVPYKVHVAGEVNKPGVYSLSPQSRVEDAVFLAGGFTQNADKDAINLAFPLQDGIQIWVPSKQSSQDGDYVGEKSGDTVSPYNLDLLNINIASLQELEALPGIGPVTAEAIIAFRQDFGSFSTIEEIQKVYGIGPAKFEQIKDLITVSGP
jgi:competence protein ComEA